ncbi:hypothetical protein W97_09245 [Coniosporium apollinis CBS 100218]|uniref:Microbial-type PARG catalytic domain-containing protein n=1 Tax=Coniosporium apollinis (strain CBS 100218) TaxID=1168221 RepID=R7Z719_CONA1|nr:uncharacterized protein W97_09245 [Coniosporium apollinis CBS 100218]EON69980.1 hypothetical protein W97_09245 [Coniosporium apollinis CBS 100218]
MGRTEPVINLKPQAYRKDARAKAAKATASKTIPALLTSDRRARAGVDAAELIVNPPAASPSTSSSQLTASNTNVAVPAPPPAPLRIRLQVADCLTAARTLLSLPPAKSPPKPPLKAPPRVALLNPASPLHPGGGFLNGATSTEEFLCMRTTLLPSLRDEFYRLPDLGGVWSPDVCVFRGGGWEGGTGVELGKGGRWYVDVLSAGMLRFPDVVEVEVEGGRSGKAEVAGEEKGGTERRYASVKDRDMVLRKMRAVMRILCQKKVEKVVLCAWGCGAYGNPVGEVARAWRKVLLGGGDEGKRKRGSKGGAAEETWEGVKEVMFAIADRRMAEGFARCFGAGLEVEMTESNEGVEANPEDDGSTQAIEELQAKVAELRIQISQVRSPHLKSRLQEILSGLEKDLADKAGSALSESSGAEHEGGTEDGLGGESSIAEEVLEVEDDDQDEVSEEDEISEGYVGSSEDEPHSVDESYKKS